MSRIISIVTDWSASLGSGHIQRMMNLIFLINSRKDFKAYLINQKKFIEGFREFDEYIRQEINPETSLIIRDLRDSSKEQIEELQKTAPVLVIDDLGCGAEASDFKINILPDPETKKHDLKKFLYGYNFINSIKHLNHNNYYKNIDISFYTGYKPSEKYVSSILELFPDNATAAVLSGENSFIYINKNKSDFNIQYSEALLKSKIVLSHFGLTIYEGSACKAVPLTLNPTEYHMNLTGIVKNELGIIDLGLIDNLDRNEASKIIKNTIEDIKTEKASLENTLAGIESASNEFYKFLLKLPLN